jgi:hypothetical protein
MACGRPSFEISDELTSYIKFGCWYFSYTSLVISRTQWDAYTTAVMWSDALHPASDVFCAGCCSEWIIWFNSVRSLSFEIEILQYENSNWIINYSISHRCRSSCFMAVNCCLSLRGVNMHGCYMKSGYGINCCLLRYVAERSCMYLPTLRGTKYWSKITTNDKQEVL